MRITLSKLVSLQRNHTNRHRVKNGKSELDTTKSVESSLSPCTNSLQSIIFAIQQA